MDAQSQEVAQFNADIVEYMETHVGMWTIRVRHVSQNDKPERPPLKRGIPYIVIHDGSRVDGWFIKHLWDARNDKVT